MVKPREFHAAGLRRRDLLIGAAAPLLLSACGGSASGSGAAPLTPNAALAAVERLAALPLAEVELPLGTVTLAYMDYVQVGQGRSLNALQLVQRMKPIAQNAAKAAALDALIAAQRECVLGMAQMRKVFRQALAGSRPVVGRLASGHPMVLDDKAIDLADRLFAAHIDAVLASGGVPAAAAGVPQFAVVGRVLNFLTNTYNMTRGTEDFQRNERQYTSSTSGTPEQAMSVLGMTTSVISVVGAIAGGIGATGAATAASGATVAIAAGVVGANLIGGQVNLYRGMARWVTAPNDQARELARQEILHSYDDAANDSIDAVKTIIGFGMRKNPLAAEQYAELRYADAVAQRVGQKAADKQAMVDAAAAQAAAPGDPSTQFISVDVQAGYAESTTVIADAIPEWVIADPSDARIESMLNGPGEGVVTLSKEIAGDPGGMCTADPLTDVLTGSVNLGGPLQAGQTIAFPRLRCLITGAYSGSFTGGDSGPVTASIDTSGHLTASGLSSRFGDAFSAAGDLRQGGDFILLGGATSGGAQFGGQLASTPAGWTMSGTWSNSRSGLSGTFALAQTTCVPYVVS